MFPLAGRLVNQKNETKIAEESFEQSFKEHHMGERDKNQRTVENPVEHSDNILVLTLNISHQSVFRH